MYSADLILAGVLFLTLWIFIASRQHKGLFCTARAEQRKSQQMRSSVLQGGSGKHALKDGKVQIETNCARCGEREEYSRLIIFEKTAGWRSKSVSLAPGSATVISQKPVQTSRGTDKQTKINLAVISQCLRVLLCGSCLVADGESPSDPLKAPQGKKRVG